MSDLRLSVISGAVLLAAWHLGFQAGQRSKRTPTGKAATQDALSAYKLMGYERAEAQKALRNIARRQNA